MSNIKEYIVETLMHLSESDKVNDHEREALNYVIGYLIGQGWCTK